MLSDCVTASGVFTSGIGESRQMLESVDNIPFINITVDDTMKSERDM